jgi:hypothetical protein
MEFSSAFHHTPTGDILAHSNIHIKPNRKNLGRRPQTFYTHDETACDKVIL